MSELVDGIVYNIDIGGDWDTPLENYRAKTNEAINTSKEYVKQLKEQADAQRDLKASAKATNDAAKATIAAAKAEKATADAQAANARKVAAEQRAITATVRTQREEIRASTDESRKRLQLSREEANEQRKIETATKKQAQEAKAAEKAMQAQAKQAAAIAEAQRQAANMRAGAIGLPELNEEKAIHQELLRISRNLLLIADEQVAKYRTQLETQKEFEKNAQSVSRLNNKNIQNERMHLAALERRRRLERDVTLAVRSRTDDSPSAKSTIQLEAELDVQQKINNAMRERMSLERRGELFKQLSLSMSQEEALARSGITNAEAKRLGIIRQQTELEKILTREKKAQELLNNKQVLAARQATRDLRLQRQELDRVGLSTTRADSLMGRLLARMRGLRSEGNNLLFTFRRLVGVLAMFTIARRVTQYFTQMIKEAINFNSVMEQASLGIASLMVASGDIFTSAGSFATSMEGRTAALEAATVEANRQLRILRIEALRTTATFEELSFAFQTAMGPGLASGFDPSQIREFSLRMSQAATAIGLPQNQLAEELRSILTGAITPRNTRIATVLGITNADVKMWKEHNVLFDQLMVKLSPFAAAGERVLDTWVAALNNAREAIRLIAGEGTIEFFEALKNTLNEVQSTLRYIQDDTILVSQGALAVFQELGKGLTDVLNIFRSVAEGMSWEGIVAAVQGLNVFLRVAATLFAGMIAGLTRILSLIGMLGKALDVLDWERLAGPLKTIVSYVVMWSVGMAVIKGVAITLVATFAGILKLTKATTALLGVQAALHKAILYYTVATARGAGTLAALWSSIVVGVKAVGAILGAGLAIALAKIIALAAVVGGVFLLWTAYSERFKLAFAELWLKAEVTVKAVWKSIVTAIKDGFNWAIDWVQIGIMKAYKWTAWLFKGLSKSHKAAYEEIAAREKKLLKQREAASKASDAGISSIWGDAEKEIKAIEDATAAMYDEAERKDKEKWDKLMGNLGDLGGYVGLGGDKDADIAIKGMTNALTNIETRLEEIVKTNRDLNAEYARQYGLIGMTAEQASIYALEQDRNYQILKETEDINNEILASERALAALRAKDGKLSGRLKAQEAALEDGIRVSVNARLQLERQIAAETAAKIRTTLANQYASAAELVRTLRDEAQDLQRENVFLLRTAGMYAEQRELATLDYEKNNSIREQSLSVTRSMAQAQIQLNKSVAERMRLEEEQLAIATKVEALSVTAREVNGKLNADYIEMNALKARGGILQERIDDLLQNESELQGGLNKAMKIRNDIAQAIQSRYEASLEILQRTIRLSREAAINERELELIRSKQDANAELMALRAQDYRVSSLVQYEYERNALAQQRVDLLEQQQILERQLAQELASGADGSKTSEALQQVYLAIKEYDMLYNARVRALGPIPGGVLDFTDLTALQANAIAGLKEMEGELGTVAQNLANTVASPFEGMKDGLVSGIREYIMETGDAMSIVNALGMGMLNSLVNSISEGLANMFTQMVMQAFLAEEGMNAARLFGATWRMGVDASETAASVGNDAVGLASHVATEEGKTVATSQGVLSRIALSSWETISLVGNKIWELMTWIWVEGQKTIITIAETLVRLPFILAEGAASIWNSISKIPYIGPFLAPLLVAGMVGSVAALLISSFAKGGLVEGFAKGGEVQGFAKGGSPSRATFGKTKSTDRKRSGAGKRPSHIDPRDVVPAWLRVGEFVMRPEAVRHYGTAFMDSVNNLQATPFDTPAFQGIAVISDNRRASNEGQASMARQVVTMRDQGFALGGQVGAGFAGNGAQTIGGDTTTTTTTGDTSTNNVNVAMLQITEGMNPRQMREFLTKAMKDKDVAQSIVDVVLRNKVQWERGR